MKNSSGQHLISAIFLREYDISTISWKLGSEISYIEIDPKKNLSQEQITRIENICNEAIAASTPVCVHVLKDKDATDVPVEVIFFCFFFLFKFGKVITRFFFQI